MENVTLNHNTVNSLVIRHTKYIIMFKIKSGKSDTAVTERLLFTDAAGIPGL